mmetsp:Transcript_2159/g.6077  ORF Transcript_2159/g.6077 Transcript_2159/m.6077 type:complete len:235 (+) Transcript_2159:106-810(+)
MNALTAKLDRAHDLKRIVVRVFRRRLGGRWWSRRRMIIMMIETVPGGMVVLLLLLLLVVVWIVVVVVLFVIVVIVRLLQQLPVVRFLVSNQIGRSHQFGQNDNFVVRIHHQARLVVVFQVGLVVRSGRRCSRIIDSRTGNIVLFQRDRGGIVIFLHGWWLALLLFHVGRIAVEQRVGFQRHDKCIAIVVAAAAAAAAPWEYYFFDNLVEEQQVLLGSSKLWLSFVANRTAVGMI